MFLAARLQKRLADGAHAIKRLGGAITYPPGLITQHGGEKRRCRAQFKFARRFCRTDTYAFFFIRQSMRYAFFGALIAKFAERGDSCRANITYWIHGKIDECF